MDCTQKLSRTKKTSQPETLLIQLYKYSQKASDVPIFKAKLSPRRNHYPELELFRQQIEYDKGNNGHPSYSMNRGKILRYRAAFYFLSLIFIGLGLVTFFHTMHWSYSLFLNAAQTAKSLVCMMSIVLAISALWVGYSLCIAKEATNHIVSRSKKRLTQIYARKRIEHGVISLFSWGSDSQTKAALKQAYYEMWDRIEEHKEETLLILLRVRNSKNLDAKTKEALFNQALGDLNDQLAILIHSFKNISFEFRNK